MLQRHRETEFDIASRKTHPALKVMQSGAIYPRIVLRPIGEALFMNLRREQFGQGGTNRLRPPPREAPPRIPLQPPRPRQPQPRFDPAGILAVTVVVENALHPRAAHRT